MVASCRFCNMSATREQQRPVFLAAVVPLSLREQVIDLAQRHDRSISGEVRVALRAHVRREREREQ